RRGRALLRPGGGGKKQREEKGDEWVHRRLGPLLYRPRSDSARGTRASSSTRRVRAVTRAAAPRRTFPNQMTAPPAATTGTPPRPGGGGTKQREEEGAEWVRRRLGHLFYRPRSDSARGTRASSSTRRVRPVTRAAGQRRSFPVQMTAPPASTTGTRQRSQR